MRLSCSLVGQTSWSPFILLRPVRGSSGTGPVGVGWSWLTVSGWSMRLPGIQGCSGQELEVIFRRRAKVNVC